MSHESSFFKFRFQVTVALTNNIQQQCDVSDEAIHADTCSYGHV